MDWAANLGKTTI